MKIEDGENTPVLPFRDRARRKLFRRAWRCTNIGIDSAIRWATHHGRREMQGVCA